MRGRRCADFSFSVFSTGFVGLGGALALLDLQER